MRRFWSDGLAAVAAAALAVVLALELQSVSLAGWVLVAAFAAAPVGLYLGLARRRPLTGDRIAFSIVLAAYVAYVTLFGFAAPHYDEDVEGALNFLIVPIYAMLALVLALVGCVLARAILGRISGIRRGRPSAAAGRS